MWWYVPVTSALRRLRDSVTGRRRRKRELEHGGGVKGGVTAIA